MRKQRCQELWVYVRFFHWQQVPECSASLLMLSTCSKIDGQNCKVHPATGLVCFSMLFHGRCFGTRRKARRRRALTWSRSALNATEPAWSFARSKERENMLGPPLTLKVFQFPPNVPDHAGVRSNIWGPHMFIFGGLKSSRVRKSGTVLLGEV